MRNFEISAVTLGMSDSSFEIKNDTSTSANIYEIAGFRATQRGPTSLHNPPRHRDECSTCDIVKRILKERSIDVNMVDSDGDDTALMLSVEGGHYDCVAMLVNYPGIDLLHEDRFGETCLRLAAIRKQFAIFELLKTAMTGSGKRRPKTP